MYSAVSKQVKTATVLILELLWEGIEPQLRPDYTFILRNHVL